jgi:hypothetical protein
VLVWLNVSATTPSPRTESIYAIQLFMAVLYTPLAALLLLTSVRFLVDPTVARFTPTGWELPAARMGGAWAGVREVRVRGLSSRGAANLEPVRLVLLVVDDPEEQLAKAPPLRRALARRIERKHGSPVAITASKRTMPASELIPLLQRYTGAPVTWG